jgi:periplasmic divalent cation tolerance protein
MIFKTRAALAEPLRAAIKDDHPYATPAIVMLPTEGGDPDYLAWIAAEAKG